MQPEHAELRFQQGSSDKVYCLQLENKQDRWSVHTQWGRHGSVLQSAEKASDTSYERAKQVYDHILREKVGKGYRIVRATANDKPALAVSLPTEKEHSGHVPELLTPIGEPEALLLAEDPDYWFQQKFDGRRLAVRKSGRTYSGINKLGQIVSIDSRLVRSLDRIQVEEFLVDGEIIGSRFYMWDLLDMNETNLRDETYGFRYQHLVRFFTGVDDVLQVCETAVTTVAKLDFVKKMHDTNAEGFVCKKLDAPYAGGRAGQHFKCKFVTTASFIVGSKPDPDDGHRSIALYLLDGDRSRFMGTVGVPDRYPLPVPGDIVEVRYLYCHPGPAGKLIQAKYFGSIRDDVAAPDCNTGQLKFKAGDDEPEIS